ncbi:insulinase family protein [Alteromonas macleodii]|uniref:Peptidase M16 domain-containing protein n=1 Tax=Alteromonas macleodii (strain English Channel 673) TaxID=1004788 RepID=A0AB33A2B7_ALTME|nr:insulinase family protein [Alteromonas macleodii]AFT75846.1 peptidase M16 domain-containing protein [Alteromonas macleodii str. 'English Channel 673']MBL3812167.1 insulinase family protein [Alteromonas macleodii]MBL3885726.1 insulinase family protein [Alteromonas macleodii]
MSEFHFIDAGSGSKVHSVVFALKTPAAGHTGLSHLAEHMSFRRSHQYPTAHELFTANTLLPVTINATTLAEYTFFFASSEKANVLLDAVNYLYCGLLNRDYGTDEVTLERDGVIFNELAMLEANSDYALNAAIRLTDTNKNAYQHAGGFTQTIGSNSIQALQDYKRQWYQPSNITTLVYSNSVQFFEQCKEVVTALSEKAALSEESTLNRNAALSQHASQREHSHLDKEASLDAQTTKGENESIRHVLTWWFPRCFLNGLQQQEATLSTVAGLENTLFIDPEINQQGNFAIRLVTNEAMKEVASELSIEALPKLSQNLTHKLVSDDYDKRLRQLKHVVSACLASFDIRPSKPTPDTDKHAEGVGAAIRYFAQLTDALGSNEGAAKDCATKSAYLASANKVSHSYLGALPSPEKSVARERIRKARKGFSAQASASNSEQSRLIPRLTSKYRHFIALEHLPALPRLLRPLANNTTNLKRFNAEHIASHFTPFSIQSPSTTLESASPNSASGYLASHWVYRIAFYQQSRLQAVLAHHRFWQPRTSGECYALGAATYENNLFLFGASDTNITERENWCHKVLSILS